MENTLSNNKKIALTGALCALIVILGMPPLALGMIRLGAWASITIMHIPVILAAMLIAGTSGLFSAMIAGATFGIFSLILAAIMPSGALDPLFVNPLVSVLPRVLLGVVAWCVWHLLNLIPHLPKPVAAAIAGFISSYAHGRLVMAALYIFAGGNEALGGRGFFALVFLTTPNTIIEAVASAIVCSAVIGAITVSSGKKSKLSQEETKN